MNMAGAAAMGKMCVAFVPGFIAAGMHSVGLDFADFARRPLNMLRRRHRREKESEAHHSGDDHAETGKDAFQHHEGVFCCR
jgi:hypothetical protein